MIHNPDFANRRRQKQPSSLTEVCGIKHYDVQGVISIDMKSCYTVSFQGFGEARKYFRRFGHP